MTPNIKDYNPDPAYLRELIAEAGETQRGISRLIGVPERTMRDFLNPKKINSVAPYTVQFAFECLAAENQIK